MPDQTRIETEHGDQDHYIRAWPLFWEAIRDGFKRFELVPNEHYLPGDTLHIYEFIPCHACKSAGVIPEYGRLSAPQCKECGGTGGRYSGRLLTVPVTYVLTRHRGMLKGYALLSLGEPVEEQGQHWPEEAKFRTIP